MTGRDQILPRRGTLADRLAGGGLLALGAVLVALGAVALLSIQLLIRDGGAVLLIGAGLVCGALGVAVWRGSRLAVGVALTLLLCLVLIQAGALVTGAERAPADLARFGLTALLAALTAAAARRR